MKKKKVKSSAITKDRANPTLLTSGIYGVKNSKCSEFLHYKDEIYKLKVISLDIFCPFLSLCLIKIHMYCTEQEVGLEKSTCKM